MKRFCEVIQQDTPVTKEDITSYKAAIWALGHVGSTQQGLDLLLNENAVEELIDLAEDCPLLSIRGYVCTRCQEHMIEHGGEERACNSVLGPHY